MYELDFWTFMTVILVAFTLIGTGIAFICTLGKNKNKRGTAITSSIIGWFLIVVSIAAIITSFIFFIDYSGGEFATYLLIFMSPLFILGGAIFTLGFGINSLVRGYHKDKEGHRNISQIVRGWALLILSIVIVTVVIISFTTLMTYYSNIRGDKPIIGMGG